jgi:O-acetyl-ADP-ribose deacetylase (regulator of RNase III)
MRRNTPEHITELGPNEYAVVGTNCRGEHHGGAAAYAHEHFGLQWGCGSGLSGQTYALSTMEGFAALQGNVEIFKQFARFNPDKTFMVTRVATGIAGYSNEEIAPLFRDAPENCVLPEGWRR